MGFAGHLPLEASATATVAAPQVGSSDAPLLAAVAAAVPDVPVVLGPEREAHDGVPLEPLAGQVATLLHLAGPGWQRLRHGGLLAGDGIRRWDSTSPGCPVTTSCGFAGSRIPP